MNQSLRPDALTLGFLSGHLARPIPMRREHLHQEVELNFLDKGSVTYLLNGRLATIPARCWCAFWAAVPHRIISVQNAGNFHWFTVPVAWVLDWSLPASFVSSLLRGKLTIGPHASQEDARTAARWRAWLRRGDRRWQEVAALEVQAGLLRLALERPGRRVVSRAAVPTISGLRHVEKISRYLAEHYQEEIQASEAARHAGLHGNYAMGLFREITGQTVLECLTQHRLAHAQRLLATTDKKIVDIALESGFASLSRFYQVFVQACGRTPRAYRHATRDENASREGRKG